MSTPAILGGEPIRARPFLARKTMGEAEKRAAMEVLDSDVLSAYLGSAGKFFLGGPRVRAFEDAWRERYGFKHCATVNSWTTGLMVALGAVGVEPGDEVICPPYTMSASATAAMFYGGIPVFADIEASTLCLDPTDFEAKLTPRTRAVVVVHLLGHPASMDPIVEIARRHGVAVIEDAAQAPGVFYRGRPVGTIGDVGGFSLNFHKHIHCGEGGVLVTDDERIARACQLIRNHGENAITADELPHLVNPIGSNYRLTELQAAIGLAQLGRLEGYLATRQELAHHLTNRLRDRPGLTLQTVEPGSTHAYYVFPVRYDATVTGLSRSMFVRAVCAELPEPAGFESLPLAAGYVKPLYLNPIYQQRRALGRGGYPWAFNPEVSYDYSPGSCPVAERMYSDELVLSPLVREPHTVQDMDD
ncbi:MAG: DegT/DnrJ/EryC1/StrS family aminotransferase, partial [Myxococcota bacterium]|nr:DegT/DnrJ/EryC1/StrS family aminotransferase [Myxococcota bacterium]